MSKVKSLKDALLDELIHQVQDGPTVVDKETGEPVRISPPASLLSVAAKVVKDFAEEIPKDEVTDEEKVETLGRFLDSKRQGIPSLAVVKSA